MSGTEDKITAWFASACRLPAGRFPIGIGDDMAMVRLGPDHEILITTDMLLEGVHFDLRRWSASDVGYRAMCASLSDCAAMATIPVAAVVSVALPARSAEGLLKKLHRGITDAGSQFACALVGGDITVWKGAQVLAVNVAMISRPAVRRPVKRSGARVCDIICVTGWLGGGTARPARFTPRVAEALKIAGIVPIHAMIDISDGLSTDLNRICVASKTGAVIRAADIPVSPYAADMSDPQSSAMNDGEDYELLFTLSRRSWAILKRRWKGKVPITAIGSVTGKIGMLIEKNGRQIPLKCLGYDHFSGLRQSLRKGTP